MFSIPDAQTITSVKVFLKKTGAPADNVVVGIQADSAGLPSGTYLSSASLASGSITVDYVEYTFTFSQALTANTTYWLVVSRSGALSDGDYYYIQKSTNDPYSGGNQWEYSAGWSEVAGNDLDIKFNITGTSGRIYKTSAAEAGGSNTYLGLVSTGGAVGASVDIVVAGVATGLSGLTVGSQYYLSNTKGAIATSAGTVSRKAGIALSATTLLITNI